MSDFSTLNGLLESAARSADGGLRILDRREHSRWLPWSEVRERAQAVAGRLREVGVLPGQRVALVYPTSVGFFDAFFGVLLAGAVPVPLYPPVRLGRLDEYHRRTAAMLRAVDARLVLTDKRVRRDAEPSRTFRRPHRARHRWGRVTSRSFSSRRARRSSPSRSPSAIARSWLRPFVSTGFGRTRAASSKVAPAGCRCTTTWVSSVVSSPHSSATQR